MQAKVSHNDTIIEKHRGCLYFGLSQLITIQTYDTYGKTLFSLKIANVNSLWILMLKPCYLFSRMWNMPHHTFQTMSNPQLSSAFVSLPVKLYISDLNKRLLFFLTWLWVQLISYVQLWGVWVYFYSTYLWVKDLAGGVLTVAQGLQSM